MPTLFLLAAILLSLLPGAEAEPRFIQLKKLKASCHKVTIAFKSDNPDGATVATVRIVANGEEIAAQSGDPTGFAAQFSFRPPPGTYMIYGEITVGSETLSGSTTITCQSKSKQKNDQRICFAPGQAPAAVYAHRGLEVWAIDANDEGVLVMDIPERVLRNLPDLPEDVHPIARSDTLIRVEFMKNPDGGFQVNVGPDAEGKVFECLFRFTAPEDAIVRTWVTQ